ncbi:SPFH domain-containing protein [Streptomyces sodiiphilus]|uniref:SPFH domain-containing protein n=1 Tax=Streptomyces sodiiphilus TaxID=226217 RepID=A0ABN2PNZ4_9ACTN
MNNSVIAWVLLGLVLVILLAAAVRIAKEYERGVTFRLGRVIGAKGPGLFFIIPVVDKVVKVSLRTVTMDIPAQDIITKDNVTIRVNAVTYFNVVEPVRSVVAIENHIQGTSQIAQTTLRSVLGQTDLDELLARRDDINQRLQETIDKVTDPWGVKVTLVEVKDVELPESMRRAMARQAESERDRRAKVIHAHGEFEAADTLGRAAEVLEVHPAAMQLRLLSTLTEVAGERNSTLIFPLPMEVLRLVDHLGARAAGQAAPEGAAPGPAGAGGEQDERPPKAA